MLGLSILLSTFLLSLVALFIATRDRWNWKKIALWLTIGPLALVLVIGILAGIFWYVGNLPKAQTEFWEIVLDSTKDDVRFLKGNPRRRISAEEASTPFGWFASELPLQGDDTKVVDDTELESVLIIGPASDKYPKGRRGQVIPRKKLQSAISQGYREAIYVVNPEGKIGSIPKSKLKVALAKGYWWVPPGESAPTQSMPPEQLEEVSLSPVFATKLEWVYRLGSTDPETSETYTIWF